jgi:threonine/homoserine/homoserine lactone efflux protein
VAAFGLTSVSGFLVDQQLLLRLVGGVFLLYLGLRTFRERPADGEAAISGRCYGGLAGTYASEFRTPLINALTLTVVAVK